eukprot:2175430-Prymnesium_polylepis.2
MGVASTSARARSFSNASTDVPSMEAAYTFFVSGLHLIGRRPSFFSAGLSSSSTALRTVPSVGYASSRAWPGIQACRACGVGRAQ